MVTIDLMRHEATFFTTTNPMKDDVVCNVRLHSSLFFKKMFERRGNDGFKLHRLVRYRMVKA